MDELKSKPRDGALFLDQSTQEDPSQFAGDGKAEEAAEILEELINLMDLDVQVDIRTDAERIELDVTGEDSGRVIGKKGAALDALQFLINKMVNRFPEGRRHVIVDSGDYRERHDDGLISMAKRQAHRAVDEDTVHSHVARQVRRRKHHVTGRGHPPEDSDHPGQARPVGQDRPRRPAGRHLVVDPAIQSQLTAGVDFSPSGQHPDLFRQLRPDRQPILRRKRRAGKRHAERRALDDRLVSIDLALERRRAAGDAQGACGGPQERRPNPPRFHEGPAKRLVGQQDGDRRCADAPLLDEQRRERGSRRARCPCGQT
ncbi:MAG: KH domain-containing protein [Deltaproteobacteria bacterium]|nr:KH domain-containing protein [Deltaproteobacteria bacterium]